MCIYVIDVTSEIDITSSGSGYERHLTNPLTTIKKGEKNILDGEEEEKKQIKNKSKEKNLSTLCTMTSSRFPL